jgi:hypothetical protein
MDYEEDEEEEVGEEVEAMKAVYETDCVIIRSIPPHFHLSLKPRTADVSYDQVGYSFFLQFSITLYLNFVIFNNSFTPKSKSSFFYYYLSLQFVEIVLEVKATSKVC